MTDDLGQDASKPLRDERHERFCLELMKGIGKRAAATAAGYKHNSAHVTANRLLNDAKILNRLDWLKVQAARKTSITLAEGTEALLRIAAASEAFNNPAGMAVARACIFSAMEVNGLIIHKSEQVDNGPRLTHAERRELIGYIKAQLSRPATEKLLSM